MANSVDGPDHLMWLTEENVRGLMTLNDAIDALADGLTLEARDQARNVDKALGTWGPSSMHALGSMMPQRGVVAFKTWANTPKGAAAVLSLFSAVDGQLLALMEAAAIGTMRTAAITGLATRCLARASADEMSLIGTGTQAMMQVAAVAATRKIRRLRVFSPTQEKRAAFVDRAREVFAFEVIESASVEDAVAGSPIVTLITRAKTPFLQAGMLARGAHVNAAGAILPGHAEFAQDVLDRATLVVVDSIGNAQKNSTELGARFGTDPAKWATVQTLGGVLADGVSRTAETDLTIFKPMGMGLSDLCVARLVYDRAKAAGVGTVLPQGKRAAPRWTPARETAIA
jgi:ornithine cyclodeaminase